MQKKVLVLMSTYNGQKYIREQVVSILEQKTEHHIMLRIRDDGSKDQTCEIIKQLQEEYPQKIELIKGENVGYNASFFRLLNGASGYDYYAISDQDDVWMNNKIQIAIQWLEKEDSNIPLLYASTSYLVHQDLVVYGTTRKKIKEFSVYNTLMQNICPGHTQVINNELLFLVNQIIDTSKIYVYDSWITNMAVLYGKILFNNESFALYRQHEGNELGYGKGRIGQLISSIKHANAGDGKKYRTQAKYFIEQNSMKLKEIGCLDELERFAQAKKISQRVMYMYGAKLHRQKKIETIAFYVAFVIGKF